MPIELAEAAGQNLNRHDVVESVYDFNRVGGPVAPGNTFNAERATFYTGMQCEELAEVLEVIAQGEVSPDARVRLSDFAAVLDALGKEFKAGHHQGAVLRADREKLLDGSLDLVVVSLGGAMYQTPMFREALLHVVGKNIDKLPNGVATRDPLTGKIMKPEGWTPPDLSPFVIQPAD